MKLMITLFALQLCLPAWAGEVPTKCPYMKEENQRSNPKINLLSKRQIKKKSLASKG
ncbi:MAG: hypothetical protein AB7I27_07750 [Bacteriovoracaceae bacterium]